MKKISAVALLLVSLSLPAFAGPRGEDPPSRSSPVQRVVKIVKHFLSVVLDDSWSIGTPKP